MIKFQYANISLAAINTGMLREVDTHHLVAFGWSLSWLSATPTSTILNAFNAMTVGTADVALGDFSFYGRPVKAPAN